LIALAILSLPQIQMNGAFRLVSSVAVGFLGIACVFGFELFLRFFDRYLSRN